MKRSCCSALPCTINVGRTHAPTWRWRRRTWASRNSSSMTSCSIGSASRPQGEGQLGTSQPASAMRRSHSARSWPRRSSRKARTSARCPSASGGRSTVIDRRAPPRGPFDDQVVPGLLAPQELAGGHGPAQEQVGVVLPCEPDAAVDLDAALGAAGEGLGGDGPGHGRGQRHFARRRRPGRRPRPRPGPARARRACRRSRCLTAWNWPMGDRTAAGPWRRPTRCRRTRRIRPPTRRPAAWRPGPGPGRGGARDRAGGPGARRRGGRWPGGAWDRGSCAPRPSTRRQEGPTSRRRWARLRARRWRHRGPRSTRSPTRSDAKATAPGVEPSASPGRRAALASVSAETVDHRRGEHGGQDRPWRHRPAQLLEDDGQLGQAEARAPRAPPRRAGPASRARPARPRTEAGRRSGRPASPGPRPAARGPRPSAGRCRAAPGGPR